MNDELKTKDELPADHAEKPVACFLQIDGWHANLDDYDPAILDDVMDYDFLKRHDRDWDGLSVIMSDVLVPNNREFQVRVQIGTRVEKDVAKRLLFKILDDIDHIMTELDRWHARQSASPSSGDAPIASDGPSPEGLPF
jgi:hypothetical protein